eukprot:359342-Chlamydomonas_euryale.AAC.1
MPCKQHGAMRADDKVQVTKTLPGRGVAMETVCHGSHLKNGWQKGGHVEPCWRMACGMALVHGAGAWR